LARPLTSVSFAVVSFAALAVESSSPTMRSPVSLSSFRERRVGRVSDRDHRGAGLDPRLELLAAFAAQLVPLVVAVSPGQDEAVVVGQVDPAEAGEIDRHDPHADFLLEIEPDGAEGGLIDAVSGGEQDLRAIQRLDALAATPASPLSGNAEPTAVTGTPSSRDRAAIRSCTEAGLRWTRTTNVPRG
jgi:hypothetical protein